MWSVSPEPPYPMTAADGIAVQAAGGTARDELALVTDTAARAWPPAR